MLRGSNSIQHRHLSTNLHKIWWCLLLTLHFYVKTILNAALYTSLYHYRYIEIHILLSICCLSLQTDIGSTSILFAFTYLRKLSFLLRMFEAHFWKKYEKVEPRWKNHHSYKRSVYFTRCWLHDVLVFDLLPKKYARKNSMPPKNSTPSRITQRRPNFHPK